MHVSKSVFYLGIIAYSALILMFWDWPAMVGTTGTASAIWLGKMAVDVLFGVGAAVLLAGPALFSGDDEDEDEIVMHKEDLPVSDTMLFGLFIVNVLANGGWHAYQSVMTTDAVSFYYSIWTMVEFVLLILCWVLFSHARKVQRRKAIRARREAEAAKGMRTVSARDAA